MQCRGRIADFSILQLCIEKQRRQREQAGV